MRYRKVIIVLVSIYFGSPQFGHTIKRNCIKFETEIQRKRSETSI